MIRGIVHPEDHLCNKKSAEKTCKTINDYGTESKLASTGKRRQQPELETI